VVTSWADHLRQHERVTRADSALEQSVRRHTRGDPSSGTWFTRNPRT